MSKSVVSRLAIVAIVAAGAVVSAAPSADARGGRHGGHFHSHTLPYGNAAIRPAGVVPSSQICSWEVRIIYGQPRAVRICDSLAY